jgi:Protein of unknown function (DUF4231)
VTPEEYIKSRVDEQIEWYDRKSGINQRGFKWMRVTEIVAAAAIPILSSYQHTAFRVTVAILGGGIAVIAGLMGLYQFQENWTHFRTTCEALRHEKFLYETGTDPYNVEQPFPLLVQRVESLISKEHSGWVQQLRAGDKEKEKNG